MKMGLGLGRISHAVFVGAGQIILCAAALRGGEGANGLVATSKVAGNGSVVGAMKAAEEGERHDKADNADARASEHTGGRDLPCRRDEAWF